MWIRLLVALLLLATFSLRTIGLDQPIFENYIGRQVPTAMVARNIERGSGFLRPRLDTAPFPNYFLVEPPIYAWLVAALRRLSGMPLISAGRLLSAFGTTLAAWGLFGLARRRDGVMAAMVALWAFCLFPITIRYGRAFQPDTLTLGAWLAGLRFQTEWEERSRWPLLVACWAFITLALSMKVVTAYLLLPIMFAQKPALARKVSLAALALAPVLLWYAWAFYLSRGDAGSRAARGSAAAWWTALNPLNFERALQPALIGRFVLWSSFTPVGIAVACWGWLRCGPLDRFWKTYLGAVALGLAILAAKLHHEYYFLTLAPVVAVGFGRGLVQIARHGAFGKTIALLIGCLFFGMSIRQSLATWRTPAEWLPIAATAEKLQRRAGPNDLLVAPEALIFAADRKGCRLEHEPLAVARAAAEWGAVIERNDAAGLTDFYANNGARWFADVFDPDLDPRADLHESLRRRYSVVEDTPGSLVVDLKAQNTDDRSHHAGHR